mgnify:CR=1 FL=1
MSSPVTLVVDDTEYHDAAAHDVAEVAAQFGQRLTLPVTASVGHGGPAQVLLEASESAALLVIGSRGRGGFARLLAVTAIWLPLRAVLLIALVLHRGLRSDPITAPNVADILVDPEKTLSLGKPVGKDSSLKTWTGDQWKIGGGSTWGFYSYDPEANLLYYGTGNPSTWNPAQRAGPDGKRIDQKWSMTIFARNPDTGVAAWAYQMTPFDEWDYDGVNESILTTQKIGGQDRKVLTHFDRNGFGYTIDRLTGEPLVAQPYDEDLNWSSGVDLDKNSPTYGRPKVLDAKSTFVQGADVNTKNICPAALGFKDQQPAAYSPQTNLFYIPVNNVCMDYEPFKVSYTPGQPYVGATLSMFPPEGKTNTGHFTIWDGAAGKIVHQHDEPFSVWSGVLTTAGGLACHGTLDGYLKCRDAKDGAELFKHRLPSGSIGNVFSYAIGGKQYIGLYSGVGGWAGIGLAAGLDKPTDGLGAVGNYAGLKSYTDLGGTLTVYSLP